MKTEIIHDRIIVYQKKGGIVHQIHDVTLIKKNTDDITIHGRGAGSKVQSEYMCMGAEIIFYENNLIGESS